MFRKENGFPKKKKKKKIRRENYHLKKKRNKKNGLRKYHTGFDTRSIMRQHFDFCLWMLYYFS